jgi:TetR/AcrR family transcriptional regulator, regulator of biofilm formation and stress response
MPARARTQPEESSSAADRRRDVLEATLRLIARGGVDAVRYRDVAEAARVPLGTVSYHFASREVLIREAFNHFLADNTRALTSIRARFAAERLDEVADYLTEIIRADFVDPQRRVLAEYELIVYAARDPAVADALATWERAMVAELAPALEGFGVPRPVATARTLIEIVRGFQLVRLARRGEEASSDLEDLRRRLHDVLAALTKREKPRKGTSHAEDHGAR